MTKFNGLFVGLLAAVIGALGLAAYFMWPQQPDDPDPEPIAVVPAREVVVANPTASVASDRPLMPPSEDDFSEAAKRVLAWLRQPIDEKAAEAREGLDDTRNATTVYYRKHNNVWFRVSLIENYNSPVRGLIGTHEASVDLNIVSDWRDVTMLFTKHEREAILRVAVMRRADLEVYHKKVRLQRDREALDKVMKGNP